MRLPCIVAFRHPKPKHKSKFLAPEGFLKVSFKTSAWVKSTLLSWSGPTRKRLQRLRVWRHRRNLVLHRVQSVLPRGCHRCGTRSPKNLSNPDGSNHRRTALIFNKSVTVAVTVVIIQRSAKSMWGQIDLMKPKSWVRNKLRQARK
jgi:hypothetical protein